MLLRAKISPPKQGVVILRRARLLERLMAGRARKVTLLEAPAGFGKTTLLAQWRELLLTEGIQVAWLTLDSNDTEERFAAYLAFALQEAGADMAATGLLRDDHHRGSLPAALALHSVLQVASRAAPSICLILDDVERVSSLEMRGQLDTLIRYAPDNLHIALAARSNPGLSLAHLTLMGLVNHIDAGSLRFTVAETSAYLEGTVPLHEMHSVTERTEGWPVAVQILRAVAARNGQGSHDMLREHPSRSLAATYLAEQLVRGLAGRQLQFLCDISLLDAVSTSSWPTMCAKRAIPRRSCASSITWPRSFRPLKALPATCACIPCCVSTSPCWPRGSRRGARCYTGARRSGSLPVTTCSRLCAMRWLRLTEDADRSVDPAGRQRLESGSRPRHGGSHRGRPPDR